MAIKKTIIGPCTPLGVIGRVATAKIVYSGSTVYTSIVQASGPGTTVTTTLRTDILNTSGSQYLKGWTTTSGGSTINYNKGASVTLNDGATLTIYPVYYKTAKIVYSGANRASTNSTSYTTNVNANASGTYAKQTLRTDIFRKLHNIATFKGWTTTNTTSSSATVNYSDGAQVTLTEGQTLTLYPVYNVTVAKTGINQGTTSETILSVNKGKTATTTKAYTFNPASHVSGYSSGEPFDINVYGWMWLPFSTAHAIKYKLGSGSYITIISTSAKQASASAAVSATKTTAAMTASTTVTFEMSVTAPSSDNTGLRYKCYITQMRIW